MASRDLLEILGSGAAFGRKEPQRRESAGRRHKEMEANTSINFFTAPAAAAGGKKRRRERDGQKVKPPLSKLDISSVRLEPTSRAPRKSSDGAALELFGKKSRLDSSSTTCEEEDPSAGAVRLDTKASLIRQEEIACFRRRMGIKVRGDDVADPIETFINMPQSESGVDALQTKRVLLKNVEESAWKEPTPVQMQAVPILVAGRDLLAAAPTGSGKTAAFVMPMILRLGVRRGDSEASGIRGILLAPTRELAAQIHRDIIRLSRGRKLRVCLLTKAGAAKAAAATGVDSKKALSGYDIVVSTPMRLVALVRDGAVSLATVQMIVLDEADKLFDAGSTGGESDNAFVGQVDEVLAACSHRDIQRALFSATIGQQVSLVCCSAGKLFAEIASRLCTLAITRPTAQLHGLRHPSIG